MSPRPAPDVLAVELRVWEALAAVHDPEIPPLAITDLGIVEAVRVTPERVQVDLLPTFAGCPALDVIREDVTAAVRSAAEGREAAVRFIYAPAWTSDRITPEGRRKLRESGFSPPAPVGEEPLLLTITSRTSRIPPTCPYCESTDTAMENRFGPTPCRSIFYCNGCMQPFEQFKSV